MVDYIFSLGYDILNNSWLWYLIYRIKFGVQVKIDSNSIGFCNKLVVKINVHDIWLFSVRDKWILVSIQIKLELKLHWYRCKKCMMYLFDTHYKWIHFCYVTFMQTKYIVLMTYYIWVQNPKIQMIYDVLIHMSVYVYV